jgi:hypothetical protein
MADIFEKCLSRVFDHEDMDIFKALKQKKENILFIEESTWRLRSRAIWLNNGDKNTKFLHKYPKLRRSRNTICDIGDDIGVIHSSKYDIKNIALKHFKDQYSVIETEDTCNQIKVLEHMSYLEHMPKFFNEIESNEIVKAVMIEEVKETVCSMPKDKSPDSDGWTRELFQTFFEIMGEDLHRVVEESKCSRIIPGALNATFFSHIPKVNKT